MHKYILIRCYIHAYVIYIIDQYMKEEEEYSQHTIPSAQKELAAIKQKAIETHECEICVLLILIHIYL